MGSADAGTVQSALSSHPFSMRAEHEAVTIRLVNSRATSQHYLVVKGQRPHQLTPTTARVIRSILGREDNAALGGTESYAAIEQRGWFSQPFVCVDVPTEHHLKRIQIETQLACNLHCTYCYSSSGPSRRETLRPDQICTLLDEVHELGVLQVDFTGGELLMYQGWQEILQHARTHGMAVTIHTNGTLVDQRTIEVLRARQVSLIQVSLDSHLPEVHDAVRGRRGALARTINGIDLLLAAGFSVVLSLMVHRGNLHEIGKTIASLAQRFPRATINVDRVIETGSVAAGQAVTNEEYWSCIAPLLGTQVESTRVCGTGERGTSSFEPKCGAFYSYVYVTAQGELASCPTMTSRESSEFGGELLHDTSLTKAWTSGTSFTTWRGLNCRNVESCPAGSTCGGGCRSNAYADTGTPAGPDLIACNLRKNPAKTYIAFDQLYSRMGQR